MQSSSTGEMKGNQTLLEVASRNSEHVPLGRPSDMIEKSRSPKYSMAPLRQRVQIDPSVPSRLAPLSPIYNSPVNRESNIVPPLLPPSILRADKHKSQSQSGQNTSPVVP